jgi:hypothetical protein
MQEPRAKISGRKTRNSSKDHRNSKVRRADRIA